jgi:Domain of unknown function (DUF1902)
MTERSIIVRADWDREAGVWVATSTDIPGLAVEAARLEDLEGKVIGALTDLMELNGHAGTLRDIPVRLMAEQILYVPSPAAA